jgi:nitroreductase
MELRPRSSTRVTTSAERRDRRSVPDEGDAGVLGTALAAALRAPSGHNTQPWRLRLVGDCVELYADRSRGLPVVDPEDRAMVISCGAALAFLVVALRRAGFAADVALLPDPGAPDLLAAVGQGGRHDPTDRDHQLFGAVARRHTHRAGFQSRAVPEQVIAAMRADVDRFGAALRVVVDDRTKQQVAELVAEGDRQQMADPRFRSELASWVRSNYTRRGDGIPGYAFGIPGLLSLVGPLFMRTVDLGKRQAVKDKHLVATAPAVLLLTTPSDTPADWLAAGQAVGTLLLTAAAAGLAASFLNQPVETSALRGPLGDLLDPSGGRPQLLLRLGYPETPGRPTPRRPLADVLVPPGAPREPGSRR